MTWESFKGHGLLLISSKSRLSAQEKVSVVLLTSAAAIGLLWTLAETACPRPVASEYLEYIGVETDAVVLIVATHWHDDHISGLAAT